MNKVDDTISDLKKIIDLKRLDNIDEQKIIAENLIEYRTKKLKGKDLTLKERVILFETLTTGHALKLEILEKKLKQYSIDNLLILIVNIALATLLIIMTIGK